MSTNLLLKTPKTHKGRRIQAEREPKVVENVKKAMFIKTNKTSQHMSDVLTDLYALKKPDGIWYRKKEMNQSNPFEDHTQVEFYSSRADASLFMLGSHNKKRPNNLVIGRTFNWQLYDMVEFGVENFKPIKDFNISEANGVGSKPMFVVAGEAFHTDEEIKNVANLIVDFYRGQIVESINLQGLDHVIVLTAKDKVIHFGHYAVKFRKSGTKIPNVKLIEIGPSMDLRLRRSRMASDALKKDASIQPKTTKPKKQKNIETSSLKETIGRIHIPDQKIDQIVTKKPKGLKRNLSESQSSSQKRSKQIEDKE